MAAPATINEFVDLVRKSGVVDEKRLDTYLEKLRSSGTMPAGHAALAGLLVKDGVLTNFQAEQILQGKWRRFTIGKYKVLERLGSGGMGQVYLCEHKLMRRRVAVKVLPHAKAADRASLDRFYREARAAAALDHPNIVHAYDIDQDDALHFIVMEYVDGASLQEIVKKSGPIDPLRAAHYIRQAAQGLDHAHQKGLVHRDIKPGNILVDRGGTAKVLDMGLARFFNDEDDILTKKYEENVLGTADYLAPEQALDSHGVDIRADIYSMGATFYFLLTGRTPFGEGTVAQKLIWHQTRQPKPVATLRPEVPAGLSAIIEKMMAKDPAQRFQTPTEVVDVLASWTQTPIPPPPDSEMPSLSPAASGGASSSDTAQGATTGGPASARRRTWQVTGTPSSKATRAPANPAPKSGSQPARPNPAPRPPGSTPPPSNQMPQLLPTLPASASVGSANGFQARPGHAPGQQPQEEPSPWEQFAPDTEDPTGQLDTAPQAPVGSRPSSLRLAGKRSSPEEREQRRMWLVVAVISAVALVLFVAIVVWFYLHLTPPPPPASRPPLDVGARGTYQLVQHALAKAQNGDVIELLDEKHMENLVIDPVKGFDTRVTLQSRGGKPVIWTAKNANDPLLQLTSAKGFHLKGNGITLDGQNKVRTLVSLVHDCVGLTVENVVLKDFTENGIQVKNCLGAPKEPVRIKGIRVSSGKGCGIFFDSAPSSRITLNDYVEVSENCEFPDPMKSPIQIRGDKVNGPSVQLPKKYAK